MLISKKRLKIYIVKVIKDTARACGRTLSEKQINQILIKAELTKKDL